ncbi:alpha/beta hydrolase [Fulvimarina sp. 2208YS6-2-32]|uniref:Alpha/beta hydrolase n=1 Tax=Fulvimarina uroteuthidis TaxID=3098149 RepID=A0ABU5HYV1_9HYPH|nr:alpha/beta hydrolase [Fulvimarina sp. 2208YS6-2-32]MDY8107738.1 alpha/beta hydrolase [Fulvimarina sp. 2208YS6-2-32]
MFPLPAPHAFDPHHIPADLRALNETIRAEHAKRPDTWSVPIEEVRRARIEGKGIFPRPEPDPHAEIVEIAGRDGRAIRVRVLRPRTREARGTFFHVHGGGWVFGSAMESDPRLRRLAEATGLVTVSVDYRLAPEHPFPAAGDDCCEAALAVTGGGVADCPDGFFAIGGESAGAHLCAATLLRLRDDHHAQPFRAALLVAGCYDLGLTPSVANFGEDRLILNSRDVSQFASLAVPRAEARRTPENSPLCARLHDMPPAFFSCGTADLLIDDTLFMAARWQAAGNPTQMSLTNGGCHVFEVFGTPSGEASLARAEAFLNAEIGRGNR